jgi:hypothetical protein
MSHMWETKGPTLDEQIAEVAADVIYAAMSDEEKLAATSTEPGFEIFAPTSTVEIVRQAVLQAQREHAAYKYGAYAKIIFALPDADE